MSIVEILYIISGACIVVVTVTIVWLANETIKLVKSLRKSSDDVAFMTSEVRDKVLLVTEALDRAGTAASNIIGLIEDAIEGIKEKRDQIANSIGLVTGVGQYIKDRKPREKETRNEAKKSKEKEELQEEKSASRKPENKESLEVEKPPKPKSAQKLNKDDIEINKFDDKESAESVETTQESA